VLVASTKLDLLRATRELAGAARTGVGVQPLRRRRGRSGVDYRVRCVDRLRRPVVASARAGDMIAAGGDTTGSGGGDRDYWDGQARRVLAALMHAAAIGGRPMTALLRWVADPEESATELTALLRSSPVPAFVADARQLLSTNERTPYLDHVVDHARARVADPPRCRPRRPAPTGRARCRPSMWSGWCPSGERCICWVGKRPRPRRWCAR